MEYSLTPFSKPNQSGLYVRPAGAPRDTDFAALNGATGEAFLRQQTEHVNIVSGDSVIGQQQATVPVQSQPPACFINPVTGQSGFTFDPKGRQGNVRPGVGGQGHFGARRAGGRRSHQGLDVSAQPVSLVYASRAGVVTEVVNKDNGGYGKYIVIDHGDGTTTKYAHNVLNFVVSTMYVPQGRVIALSGQTGNATGQPRSEAHVHFEIRKNGRPTDPATWLKFSCLNWRVTLP